MLLIRLLSFVNRLSARLLHCMPTQQHVRQFQLTPFRRIDGLLATSNLAAGNDSHAPSPRSVDTLSSEALWQIVDGTVVGTRERTYSYNHFRGCLNSESTHTSMASQSATRSGPVASVGWCAEQCSICQLTPAAVTQACLFAPHQH